MRISHFRRRSLCNYLYFLKFNFESQKWICDSYPPLINETGANDREIPFVVLKLKYDLESNSGVETLTSSCRRLLLLELPQ